MLKTCLSVFFSMFMVVAAGKSFGQEPNFTEVEPNNTPAQANAIRLNQTVIGTFHSGDMDAGDHYTLTAPGKGRMTATVVLTNNQCGVMVGAKGFHADRRDSDWVPSSSSQPAWIHSKKGDPQVSFSFPVQAGLKGYIFISGPELTEGGFAGYNWSSVSCSKGGDFHILPRANEAPRDVPSTYSGRRVQPPIQYRLVVTFAADSSADQGKPPVVAQPVQPPIVTPPPPQPPKLADISKDIVINPGTVWEGDLPASRTLNLLARLQYANVAGANRAFDISVNGQRLSSALVNKGPQFTIKDGRSFPYFDGTAWALFYSPDFSANNGPGAGGYQVVTNAGEAYRYRWDISAMVGSAPTMRIRIANTNSANSAAIVLHFNP